MYIKFCEGTRMKLCTNNETYMNRNSGYDKVGATELLVCVPLMYHDVMRPISMYLIYGYNKIDCPTK